ncbi:DUF480 domain-containing protein [Microbulbifer sp. SAOS-129_SWC]|uniref:YceH family protein n=1 Tax=Microbulbifer sp. SAOS-129_SWC TaxID=3145235 RepID=UPI0032169967
MKQDYSPHEIRVLGVLIEKSITTPDHYPLTLNSLVAGCNQKSNRNPVLNLSEHAVADLARQLSNSDVVVIDNEFGRVERYRHRFCNTEFSQLQVTPAQLAVLCELFLRGPQTPGELRSRASRMHPLATLEPVEAALQGLMQHPLGPLVAQLPREPGRRESRYTHLFCGDVESAIEQPPDTAAPASDQSGQSELAQLRARVAQLEAENTELKAQLQRLTDTRQP